MPPATPSAATAAPQPTEPGSRWPAGIAVAALWTSFLPSGTKYPLLFAFVGWAYLALRRRGALRLVWQQPPALPAALLAGWLALSGMWSPAPWTTVLAHTGLYALPLCAPLLAAALPAGAATVALRQFCFAAALAGGLFVLDAAGLLPAWPPLQAIVAASGNQRIANSLLLALGAALALWWATRSRGPASAAAWLALAAITALGLALQDRRTGFIVLPLVLLAWATAAQRQAWQKLALVTTLGLCTALAWQASDNVRARFAEGVQELRQYRAEDAVSTSWGQRLRMLEITTEMVAERPLWGHGVGSWKTLWDQRTPPATALRDNTTPHNEYLLTAAQGGAVALLLLAWLLAAGLRQGWRGGPMGVPLLMVWLALGACAAFNAVLRDGKFSLPLLMLAGCCAALAGAAPRTGAPEPAGPATAGATGQPARR